MSTNNYHYLVNKCKNDSLKCTIVRDEGVYKTQDVKKNKIFEAYSWLTNKILQSSKEGIIKNYNTNFYRFRGENLK